LNHKRITMSIIVATLILVSLFAVVSSSASVSGTTMAGTGPAVSTEWGNNGQTDIFAVDASGTLWTKPIYNGGPIDNGIWHSLGGRSTASPAAFSWGSTASNDVFVRGTDGALWHICSDNGGSTWSNWESLGGRLAPGTGPAVSSWSAGRLDVFVEGTDGALWHKAWTGAAWSNWQSLGGKLTSSPAATSGWGSLTPSSSGSIYTFVRGTDGAVWQKFWDGRVWSSWTSFGGRLAPNTGPAVSQNLWVNVQGTDNKLWQKAAGSSGTSWSAPGSPPEALSASSPASVCVIYMDHTMVCVSSNSGNLWYGVHNVLGQFPQWVSVGSPP